MLHTFIKLLIAGLFVASLSAHAGESIVTLDLPTMNCAMCPFTVKKALEKVDGVHEVSVSYEIKQATVRFENNETSAQKLIETTTNAGYPSTLRAETSDE